MPSLLEKAYNPDVLTCLANLSNDEVFTPPELANDVLDMLPSEIWSDPTIKILDPCCKSGVFLREAAKRFIKGLEHVYPDLQERVEHIMHEQLFGIAITELTSLLSRRSLYCSKFPNGKFSVAEFDSAEGNVRHRTIQHTWVNNRCKYCGASNAEYDRDAALETHAYEFIHTDNPERILNMKFDVIVGNPPYQLSDGGNGVSAAPIFQHFIEQAIKLQPRYLSMIIPARWYAGGKGLKEFRDSMLSDRRMRKLVDFESSKDCFDGVNIAGGICYFLWDRDYQGPCTITNMRAGHASSMDRMLDEHPVLIRSNIAVSIVRKVLNHTNDMWSDHALPRNPFGFATNYRGREQREKGDIEILTSKGFQYVSRQDVSKNTELIDDYKVLIGRLVPNNGELDTDPSSGYRVITDTRIIGPAQINTETYLDIGVFHTEAEARNFDLYLRGKFSRFLLRQAISSLNVTRECFRFVPNMDFTRRWTDADLYKTFELTPSEAEIIESTIRDASKPGDPDD